jgi:hypothetical protein
MGEADTFHLFSFVGERGWGPVDPREKNKSAFLGGRIVGCFFFSGGD